MGFVTAAFLAGSLFLGATDRLRGEVLAGFLSVGVGALLVGSVLLMGRGRASSDDGEPARVAPPTIESAFVCAECQSYVPAPDWDALLRESGPWDDLAAEAPTAVPAGVGLPALAAVEAPPTFSPPIADVVASDLGADLVAAPPDPAGEPEIDLDAQLVLLDGRRMPIAFAGVAAADRPRPDENWMTTRVDQLPWAAGENFPEVAGAPIGLSPWVAPGASAVSELDELVGSEVVRIVGQSASPYPPTPSGRDPGGWGRLPSVAMIGPRRLPTCAICRDGIPDTSEALRCSDCRRPVCEPCRDRVVEHDGRSWCHPCAVNQMGAQFLGVYEVPIGGPVPR